MKYGNELRPRFALCGSVYQTRTYNLEQKMGRGNWIPDTPIYQGDYDLVYVEVEDVSKSSPDEDVTGRFKTSHREALQNQPVCG